MTMTMTMLVTTIIIPFMLLLYVYVYISMLSPSPVSDLKSCATKSIAPCHAQVYPQHVCVLHRFVLLPLRDFDLRALYEKANAR